MVSFFKQQFDSGLTKLLHEVNAYTNTNNMWVKQHAIGNSGGTLTLHLIGNLNHFIGAQLGNTGYVRNREKEFTDTNIPVEELRNAITAAQTLVNIVFSALPETQLNTTFPLNTFGENKSTAEVLLILLGHFNYHLGQINYHRRLLDY